MTTVQRFGDQKLEKGVGAGVWATAPLFRISVCRSRAASGPARACISCAGLTF